MVEVPHFCSLRLLARGAPYVTQTLTSEKIKPHVPMNIPMAQGGKTVIFRSKIGIAAILGEGAPSF